MIDKLKKSRGCSKWTPFLAIAVACSAWVSTTASAQQSRGTFPEWVNSSTPNEVYWYAHQFARRTEECEAKNALNADFAFILSDYWYSVEESVEDKVSSYDKEVYIALTDVDLESKVIKETNSEFLKYYCAQLLVASPLEGYDFEYFDAGYEPVYRAARFEAINLVNGD
ncbi:MAG: hypothetical protein ABJ327_12705 [Litoreibacter sp.]